MDGLKNYIENLKEKIKGAWAEQQEAEWYISLSEKFEALPPMAQKGIMAGVVFVVALLFLWFPLSNFLDSVDFNSQFEERREQLKELLRIERDLASGPDIPLPPTPASMKSQFENKLSMAGVTPQQIKDQKELEPQSISGAKQNGYQYVLEHLTIRQATDLAYEFEQTDKSFKIAGLELRAEPQDPHYYEVTIGIVSFAPKIADVGTPGKGIVDVIKKSRGKEEKNNNVE